MATRDDVAAAYRAIVRIEASQTEIDQASTRIDTGTLTLETYINTQIEGASTSTIPAYVFAAQFIGASPTSAYLDALSSFARAQYASYVAMGSAQPQLGPYEALGRAFADTDAFKAKYGLGIVGAGASFVLNAYQDIFGRGAMPDQYANLKGQLDYFEGLYLSAGMTGGDAAIHARGAVFGQMIGYQQTVQGERDITVLDEQARVFLSVVAKGGASAYGGSLETLPVPGRTIDQQTLGALPPANQPIVIGPGPGPLGTTIYADHVTVDAVMSTIGSRGVASIDTGQGDDTIDVGAAYASARIMGGAGNDRISITQLYAFAGQPSVDAGPGNDVIEIGRSSFGVGGGGGSGSLVIGNQGNDALTIYGPATNLFVSGVETIIGSAGDDSLNVTISSEAIPTAITLGAGKDKLTLATELSNLKIVNGAVASLATVTDFVKGDDALLLANYGAPSIAPAGTAGAGTLEAALSLVASATSVGGWTPFEYGSSTYVFKQNGDMALGTGDGLVKLAGATGLVIGSAAGSDLVFS